MPAPVTANLGFPRTGVDRELDRAVERSWKGEHPGATGLPTTSAELRRRRWALQVDAGLGRSHGVER